MGRFPRPARPHRLQRSCATESSCFVIRVYLPKWKHQEAVTDIRPLNDQSRGNLNPNGLPCGVSQKRNAPSSDIEPVILQFADDGDIPNNSLPLVFYPRALDPSVVDASLIEGLFTKNGWPDGWRNGVFPFPHYHSNAHEVLSCYRGQADIRLGGRNGGVQRVTAGDVVILPAGVGHENLGSSADFAVVGSYPLGQSPDLCRGGERPRDVLSAIAAVPQPASDPVFGKAGGLCGLW